ncbi:MAG: hypothetical protein AB7O73_03165 [Bacteroidia bacterium]
MEENSNANAGAKTSAGKGLSVSGFVIALVALVLWIIISGIAAASAMLGGGMGLAIFWLILSLLGTGLSVMGFMAASKGNGKKGLGVAGLVIGIVATILSFTTVMAVKKVHDTVGDVGKEMMENLSDTAKLRESLEGMFEEAANAAEEGASGEESHEESH